MPGCHGAATSRIRLAASVAALALGGCSAEADPGTEAPASVDVGLPGGADGLEFVPLVPGASVPLQTFGQGGTHALLAVRTLGLGNRAFVGVSIETSSRATR